MTPESKKEIEMICADLMDLVSMAASRQIFKIVQEIVALNKVTVKEAYASGKRAGIKEATDEIERLRAKIVALEHASGLTSV